MIDKGITIEELVTKYPASVRFLSERGVRCVACGEPVWGTLEEAAMEKGFSGDEINRLVIELKEIIKHS